jgi:hypothetical protein
VKNIKANSVYVHNLLKTVDILCLQEHWLFNFQKNLLHNLTDSHDATVKCTDDNNPIPPIQVPRGYGGVCTLYPTALDYLAAKPVDGSNRIALLDLQATNPICIINAYMPSRGLSSTELEYSAVLDELSEIILKYERSHAIILCGDWNASHTDRNISRDKKFQRFCVEMNLVNKQNGQPTFFHSSNDSTSEIDYILFHRNALHLLQGIEVHPVHPTNTSDHTLVTATIQATLERREPPKTIVQTKPKWDMCDMDSYRDYIETRLNTTYLNVQSSFDLKLAVNHLTRTLHGAAKMSIPKYGTQVTVKPCNRRVWSEDINNAMKASKEANAIWRKKGRPKEEGNVCYTARMQARKSLRRIQRREAAKKRDGELADIASAEANPRLFHKLINRQRNDKVKSTTELQVDGEEYNTPDEILQGWTKYFGKLSTPQANEKYDEEYQRRVRLDVLLIEDICSQMSAPHRPVTCAEVKRAISRLSSNKAADSDGLMSEHLKVAGDSIVVYLTDLINAFIRNKEVPEDLKDGLLTPVHKKGATNIPTNYRGITVTSIILKVLEIIHGNQVNPKLQLTQSKLQGGFTTGSSSTNTALLLTEAVNETRHDKRPLFVSFLDAEKAFDVVNHDSLLRKLYFDGLYGDSWLLLRNMYNDLTTAVKWRGRISDKFPVKQGVRQGGVLSTTHYKRYNNPLLLTLEENYKGASIGYISIPHVTCADDIAVMSHQEEEVQSMHHEVESYASQERYNIQAAKSETLVYNEKRSKIAYNFKYEGEAVKKSVTVKHLGVARQDSNHLNIETRLQLGRRTAYSLMGAGMHGRNGLTPSLCIKMWQTYVIPRFTYGLEVLYLLKTDLDTLETLQRKMLKQIQFLPDRTPTVAVYILLGAPPIEALLHKRILTLFASISRKETSIELELARRQLSVKSLKDDSWFSDVRKLLWKYELPSVYSIMDRPPSKPVWKRLVDKAVNSHWEKKWSEEVEKKSSLKYLSLQSVAIGKPHVLWSTVRNNSHDVGRAAIKARLLTGTYILQGNRAVFNQYSVDATCRLCGMEPETRAHFIATCPTLEHVRTRYRQQLTRLLGQTVAMEINGDCELFTQLMLDSSSPCLPVILHDCVASVELLSREMISRLHHKRSVLLNEMDD